MKAFFLLLSLLLLTSCQVTETISINEDGSGTIVLDKVRDENFFHRIESVNKFQTEKENEFIDSTFVFKDFITKYNATYNKFLKKDQDLLQKHQNIVVHFKKDSYNKQYNATYTLKFNKVHEIPDNFFDTQKYAIRLKDNHVLTTGDYFSVAYTFNGLLFKRTVFITDKNELEAEIENVNMYREMYLKYNPVQNYTLQYTFPRKIKSVSNTNAKVSDDKTTLTLNFLLSDCLKNPEITNLEVVLED